MTQSNQITPDWIAAYWGPSQLQVWAMQGTTVLARAHAPRNPLDNTPFETALLPLIEPWLGANTPVIAAGQIGEIGAPFRAVPCTPLAAQTTTAPSTDSRLNLHVITGLKQNTPADMMCGAETQIAGFLALNIDWDGVIYLPDQHSRWVHISAGEVVSFQTFMTGEQLDWLCTSSSLQHAIDMNTWDDAAFENALSDTLSRPERLAGYLFNLRAQDALQTGGKNAAFARASGLLIGAELGGARPFWLGQNIAIIGENTAANRYASALRLQGVQPTIADAERMTLAGLQAAYRLRKSG